MKYGILGDIHSNLSALEEALSCLDAFAPDQLLSVGDVVGYGAAPSECIRLLIERNVVVVKGNHDAACAGELDERGFNAYARAAVAWTRAALTAEEIAWLRALPLVATLPDCQVAHGTIHHPELYDYTLSITDADPSIDALERPVGFVGHSHVPLSVLRLSQDPPVSAYALDPMLDLMGVARALINVGSVGQPRDEDPRAACVLFDSELQRIWIHRCEYDIPREARRIRDAGLPQVLADRLELGL